MSHQEKMFVRWVPQSDANAFIERHHRHHKRVVGAITCIGAFVEHELIGVAVLSRPVGRKVNYFEVLEVTRLCTNGTQNACSKLYATSARIAKEMGFLKIQTYILASESGVSLKASGWVLADEKCGKPTWNNRESFQITLLGSELKRPLEYKNRYERILRESNNEK